MGPQKVRLPDGKVIEIPDGLSVEAQISFLEYVQSKYETESSLQNPFDIGPLDLDAFNLPPISGITSGIGSLQRHPGEVAEEGEEELEEGTLAGSAWEAIKAVPRGAKQAGIMALMGIEGLRTPDENTAREIRLRAKLQKLMMEIDPKYRDAHLPQLGMALGQIAGLVGTAMIPGVGKPIAATSGMLMMAGDAAQRVAEYEEQTGEDVSKAKEILALGAGLGLGLTEMMPLAKYARTTGLFGRAAREAAEKAADDVGWMTAKQFRGHLVPSAVKQAVAEGIQEGGSEYALSAAGRLLYDEDGVVNAGSDALQEAFIGGEAGAIADVVMNLVARRKGIHALKSGNAKSAAVLEETFRESLESGEYEADFIDDFVTGGDVDAVRQRLEADPDVAPEDIESHPDFIKAMDIASVHEAILDIDQESKLPTADKVANAQRNAEEEKVELDLENKTITEEQAAQRFEEIKARSERFTKMMGIIRAALSPDFDANIKDAVGTAIDDPDEDLHKPLTEKEIDTENKSLAERSEEIQKDLNRRKKKEDKLLTSATSSPQQGEAYRQETGTKSEGYLELEEEKTLIDQSIEVNEGLRKRMKAEQTDLSVDVIAPQMDYDGSDLELQLAEGLRPTVASVEQKAELDLNTQLERLGTRVSVGEAQLKKADTKIGRLKKGNLNTEEKKKITSLEKEKRVLESEDLMDIDRRLAEYEQGLIEEAQQGAHEQLSMEMEEGEFNSVKNELLTQRKYELEQGVNTEAFQQTQALAVADKNARLAELDKQIVEAQADRLLQATEAERNAVQAEVDRLRDGRAEIEKTVEDVGGTATEQVVLTQGLRTASDPKYLNARKKQARKKLKNDGSRLIDLVGRLVTQKQRDLLMRLIFDPSNPETWPAGYASWHQGRSLSGLAIERNARDAGYNNWVFNTGLTSVDFPVGMLIPVDPSLTAPEFPGDQPPIKKGQTLEQNRNSKPMRAFNKARGQWIRYRGTQVAAYSPSPLSQRQLSGAEIKNILDTIFGGGLHTLGVSTNKRNKVKTVTPDPSGPPIRLAEGEAGFVVDMPTTTPKGADRSATKAEEKAGRERARGAYDEVLGWWSTLAVAKELEKSGKDRQLPSRMRKNPQMKALYTSLGILAPGKMRAIVQTLRRNNFEISIDVIRQVLEAKNFNVPSNLAQSSFFKQLVKETAGANTTWVRLSKGEKEAVLSRVIRTKARPDRSKEGQAKRVELRELKRLQGQDEALPKTQEEQKIDRESLVEAKTRIERWGRAARRELDKLGFPDVAIAFTANVGSMYEGVKDVIINGAYQLEKNQDGTLKLDDNDRPIIKTDESGVALFKDVYENGAVASLENFGARIIFNISQIESQYSDGMLVVEDVIKNAAAHEGTHLLFLKNELKGADRRALEMYGRKQRVPAEVDQQAYDDGVTWRDYIKSKYSNLSEADLTEETSVHILDALTQGNIPDGKAAGVIGKIKRQSIGMFKAVFGASQDGDILPVLRVFEKIKQGEIIRERQRRAEAGDLVGASSLRLIDRADPDDIKELNLAIREGDKVKEAKVAKKIVRSRSKFAENDTRTSQERLLESFVSEMRARDSIEDTSTSVVKPILNREAIESGEVTKESLNALFKFWDGRKPSYRMPVEKKELRLWRWGSKESPVANSATLDELALKHKGVIGTDSADPGTQVTSALDYHNRLPDGTYIENEKDFKRLIGEYAFRDNFRRRILDKRLPQLLSAQRADKRQLKLYETALGRLAENSAVAAWRAADNALNYIPGVMKYGMLSYVNGGFSMETLYAKDADGNFVLKDKNTEDVEVNGEWPNRVKVKGLFDIFKPIIENQQAHDLTLSYMTALRAQGVQASLDQATQELNEARAMGADAATITMLEIEQARMLELYDDTNPIYTKNQKEVKSGNKKAGERFVSDEFITDYIDQVNNPSPDTAYAANAAKQFAIEYGYFNHYLIEFAYTTGELSRADANFMQSMPYVPFYRDEGWENNTQFENQHSIKGSLVGGERTERELTQEEQKQQKKEGVMRGADLIDRSIRGSFKPIKNDLFGSITRNVNSLIRDSMTNIGATRTMRDEVANSTGVEIPEFTQKQEQNLAAGKKALKIKRAQLKADKIKLRDPSTGQMHPELEGLEAYVKGLEAERISIEKKAKIINKELDKRNFSTILVRVKGVARPLEPSVDINNVRSRLAEESNVEVSDITNEQVQKEIAGGELVLSDYTAADPNRPSDMLNNGEHKVYRVMDPELSQAIMNIGFSPKQSIESFLTGKVGLPPNVSGRIAKVLVGASTVLREAVTRSPPFMIKNILRDAMQATVVYGGGPPMFFKILGNVFQADIVQRAEMAGLGIGVDWSPDPADVGKGVRKMLKKEQMSWMNPLDFAGNVWGALGNMSKRSEVATRMAVYDHSKASGMTNAEATNQAIEIINYGRRGASPMFALITAMAPFLNGRIQGLDVTYRTHMGVEDVPGLFPGSGGGLLGTISEEQRLNSRAARIATIVGRGSLIASTTLLYYMLIRDEEEYKNAREDVKNDWWLIPMGKGRPGLKIPIPFEVGFLYKVIPEQLARVFFEGEHDLRDMRNEVRRQVTGSLMVDLRPQIMRPIIDAMRNKDSYQRDDIVPSWMEETVTSTEQFNPYTNMFTRVMADSLDKVPLAKNLDFLTSPMKLEYILRQYFGTIGSYVMATADGITRKSMGANIVGTQADFPLLGWGRATEGEWRNLPGIREMIFDPRKGGGYQEDFYELVEDVDKLVTTLGQIEANRGSDAGYKYEQEHEEYLRNKDRVRHFETRMKHWREDRDALFSRNDIGDDEKRRVLHRMFEQRDDVLEEMLQLMTDIRKERGVFEQLLGKRP